MTNNTSPRVLKNSSSLAATIIVTAVLAGTLDIAAAIINFTINGGKDPSKILVYIASAVFGKEAFAEGNANMAAYGLFFHYVIALIWTVLFFLLYPKVSFVTKNRYITGVGYGLIVWLVMNLIVVPLSHAPRGPFRITSALIGAGILIVAIGIPLSWVAHRYYTKRRNS